MNPAAAAPISQEPMRRSLCEAAGKARSAAIVVIPPTSFVLRDDRGADSIAALERCNKGGGSIVLTNGDAYEELGDRGERVARRASTHEVVQGSRRSYSDCHR